MGVAEQTLGDVLAAIEALRAEVRALHRPEREADDPWWSLERCGEHVDHSRAFVRRRVDDGRVRARKIDGVLRIRRTDWLRYVAQNTEEL